MVIITITLDYDMANHVHRTESNTKKLTYRIVIKYTCGNNRTSALYV